MVALSGCAAPPRSRRAVGDAARPGCRSCAAKRRRFSTETASRHYAEGSEERRGREREAKNERYAQITKPKYRVFETSKKSSWGVMHWTKGRAWRKTKSRATKEQTGQVTKDSRMERTVDRGQRDKQDRRKKIKRTEFKKKDRRQRTKKANNI